MSYLSQTHPMLIFITDIRKLITIKMLQIQNEMFIKFGTLKSSYLMMDGNIILEYLPTNHF